MLALLLLPPTSNYVDCTGIYNELIVYFSKQEDENAEKGSRSSEVGMSFSKMLDTLSNHSDLVHKIRL